MLSEKLGRKYKETRNKAGKLIILGIAFVKIGDIKNYANKSQVCDFLGLFSEFKELDEKEKLELLNDLEGYSLFFYTISIRKEWVFCE